MVNQSLKLGVSRHLHFRTFGRSQIRLSESWPKPLDWFGKAKFTN